VKKEKNMKRDIIKLKREYSSPISRTLLIEKYRILKIRYR